MGEDLGNMAQGILAGLNEAIAHAKDEPNTVRTTFHECADAKAIREKLGMSQSEFCKTYGIPLNTLQNWEQGRNNPDRTASAYLWAISELPRQISEAHTRRQNETFDGTGALAF
ncbi:MAG: helix-turn-helix domain-containing protein [Magnetococcales bacterium]|nr:helix-turn-helix domain-containing protein [Magnetococcales bacterium]